MAERVQLRRTKGWKMPPNTVIVSRPSRYGNSFKVGDYVRLRDFDLPLKIRTPAQAVALFAMMCEEVRPDLSALKGKNLACWCGPGPCHADVLLELANPPGEGEKT